MKSEDAKLQMLEHSEAKIELYGLYLSRYLNILSRVPTVERIFIFDLMCGEGIYDDDSKGSPLIALETIKNHFFSNNQTCPDITVWFNDSNVSAIEADTYKIDRVKRFSEEIFLPQNVELKFFQDDFDHVFPEALRTIKRVKYSKALFFLDQYGYKLVTPKYVEDIISIGNTEALLFLATSHMYRFAEKAMQEPFQGGKPLRAFLLELFGQTHPQFNSVHEFIVRLKEQFREHLNRDGREVFVDTFTLQRNANNVYALFFFTSNAKGYEKMLDAKWKLDSARGKGFTLNKTMPLFSETQLTGYREQLITFIKNSEYRTNEDVYLFSLEKGFLPKHTNPILYNLRKEGIIEVFSLDGEPAGGHYLEYNSERRVGFKYCNEQPDQQLRLNFQ